MLIKIGRRSFETMSDAMKWRVNRLTRRQQGLVERNLRHICAMDMLRTDTALLPYADDLRVQLAIEAAVFRYPLTNERIDMQIDDLGLFTLGAATGSDVGRYRILINRVAASRLPFENPELHALWGLDARHKEKGDLYEAIHGGGKVPKSMREIQELSTLMRGQHREDWDFNAHRILGNTADLVCNIGKSEITHVMHAMWENKFHFPHTPQMGHVIFDPRYPERIDALRAQGLRFTPFTAWGAITMLSETMDDIGNFQDMSDSRYILDIGRNALKQLTKSGRGYTLDEVVREDLREFEEKVLGEKLPEIFGFWSDFTLSPSQLTLTYMICEKMYAWFHLGYLSPDKVDLMLDYLKYYLCFLYPERPDTTDFFQGDIKNMISMIASCEMEDALSRICHAIMSAASGKLGPYLSRRMFENSLANLERIAKGLPVFAVVDIQEAIALAMKARGMTKRELDQEATRIIFALFDKRSGIYPDNVIKPDLAIHNAQKYIDRVTLAGFVNDLRHLLDQRIRSLKQLGSTVEEASLQQLHDDISLDAVATKKYLRKVRTG